MNNSNNLDTSTAIDDMDKISLMNSQGKLNYNTLNLTLISNIIELQNYITQIINSIKCFLTIPEFDSIFQLIINKVPKVS